MDKLVEIISQWPVIIQGALGSALFAFFLYAGQRLFALVSASLSNYSKQGKESYLNQQWQKYAGLKAHYDGDKLYSANILVGLTYQSLRSLFTGLIWLALGLIFREIVPVFGMVGFVGCLYFMFQGLGVVQRIDKSKPPEEKLEEIEAELKALKSND